MVLRAALSDVFAMIDEGWLGRDISKDHEPDWAMKQAPYLMRLKAAQKSLFTNPEPVLAGVVRQLVRALKALQVTPAKALSREELIQLDHGIARYALEETEQARKERGL